MWEGGREGRKEEQKEGNGIYIHTEGILYSFLSCIVLNKKTNSSLKNSETR